MRKAYLFVYSSTIGTRDMISNYFNHNKMVIHWRYDMNNSYYIISENSSEELAKDFRKNFPSGRFLFTELGENKYGWLTRESWDLIKSKTRKKTNE